jgi:hypothetical protein
VKGKRKAFGVGETIGLALPPLTHGGAYLLESREARTGTAVRLLDGGRRVGKGRVSIVERTYGHPDYLALEVRFEDGSAELCWHHELERTEGPPSAQNANIEALSRRSEER